MNKKIASFLLALLLIAASFPAILNCGASAVSLDGEDGQTLGLVTDDAGLLTDDELQSLNSDAQEVSDEAQCDVIIVTVDDTEGLDAMDYAKQIYTNYGLGYGDGKSGVMLLVGMNDRSYAVIAYGYGNTAFTDYGRRSLEDAFLGDLSAGNYYSSFSTYINTCKLYLDLAREGYPYDSDSDYSDSGTDYSGVDTDYSGSDTGYSEMSTKELLIKLAVVIFVPLLIALFICLYFKKQMKTAVPAHGADRYIPEDGFRLTGKSDTFLYRTEVRHIVEDNSHSGGGGTSVGRDGFSGNSGHF